MSQLRKTLEQVYVEPWICSQCATNSARLLDLDMLGDRMLPSAQSRHLLLLCCPCSTSPYMEDLGRLAKSDSSNLLEDILKVSRTRRKIMIFLLCLLVFVTFINFLSLKILLLASLYFILYCNYSAYAFSI